MRASAGVSINRLAFAGNGLRAGKSKRRGHAFHQVGVARDSAGQRGELERYLSEPNHRGDQLGKRSRLPGRVVPVGAVGVDFLVDRGQFAAAWFMPSRQRLASEFQADS